MTTLATSNAQCSGGITLDPAQRAFFRDAARVQAVCWHRQKGKDFATAGKAVLHAMEHGQPWYIVSLTQRQADATFEKCKLWARYYQAKIIERESEHREFDSDFDYEFIFKARELVLPNGGRVVSLPGRDPDRLAGLTGNVVFTEFGLFPRGGYDHWRVVFPLATRGYHVIAISTPRGKDSKFYELVSHPETYSVHFCDIHQSLTEGFILLDQEGKPCDLEAFKELYGDEIGWRREYELKFLGALETLLKWAQLEAAGAAGRGLPFDFLRVEGGAGWDTTFLRALAEIPGRPEIGWDVARRGHLSSLWINDGFPDSKRLRFLILMRDCSFSLQREIVSAAISSKPTAVGCGDATGLGMDSNETLSTKFPGRWEGIDFSGKRKSDLGSGLATAFRDQSQILPPLDGENKFIATDLYAVQREAGSEDLDAQGKTRLKLVESENPLMPESHCDIAWSGALALRAGHATPAAQPIMAEAGGVGRGRWQ